MNMKKTHLTAALLILQLGRTVSAQEMSFGSCQIFGQVFGIDPLGGDMLIKSPSGDIGGLRFDRSHHRYFFPPLQPGHPREVSYRPLNQRRAKRKVVWQPERKATGEPRPYWLHLSVSLRFLLVDPSTWCLAIRPGLQAQHVDVPRHVPGTRAEQGSGEVGLRTRVGDALTAADHAYARRRLFDQPAERHLQGDRQ